LSRLPGVVPATKILTAVVLKGYKGHERKGLQSGFPKMANQKIAEGWKVDFGSLLRDCLELFKSPNQPEIILF